jgi:hypothetical protein
MMSFITMPDTKIVVKFPDIDPTYLSKERFKTKSNMDANYALECFNALNQYQLALSTNDTTPDIMAGISSEQVSEMIDYIRQTVRPVKPEIIPEYFSETFIDQLALADHIIVLRHLKQASKEYLTYVGLLFIKDNDNDAAISAANEESHKLDEQIVVVHKKFVEKIRNIFDSYMMPDLNGIHQLCIIRLVSITGWTCVKARRSLECYRAFVQANDKKSAEKELTAVFNIIRDY